ncbi:hypothetical protein B0H14DRAFT_2560645 [Mycena olivaceomarginata]|nr:hypothetical protein B0H14DRAFT_2560645 [Mycena olivaceomarginata]
MKTPSELFPNPSVLPVMTSLLIRTPFLVPPPVPFFAGEIARKRQLFRDLQHSQKANLSGIEGAAARTERREALEYAAKVNKPVVDEGAVSIPSTNDDEQSAPISPKVCLLVSSLALFLLHYSYLPLRGHQAHPYWTSCDRFPHPKDSPQKRLRSEDDEQEGASCRSQSCASLFVPGPVLVPIFLPVKRRCAEPSRLTDAEHYAPRPTRSEAVLRRRLAAVKAEIHRLSCTVKQLCWALEEVPEAYDHIPRTQIHVCSTVCYYSSFYGLWAQNRLSER